MKAENLKGVWTALITPFKEDESIDWEAWDGLVEKQLVAGVAGLLVCGTTGESPTISDEETTELIKRTKNKVGDKCLILVGSGTNSTKKSIEKTKKAKEAGADLVLIVNPYYNKPTQEGLYLHFNAIAKSTDLPIILYNIKGRTGVNLETETLKRIVKDNKNVLAVKEASGDVEQIKAVGLSGLENFIVLSGDDGLTCQVMREAKAQGVISVASNILPEKVKEMVDFALAGNFAEAEKIDQSLQDFFKKIFVETNPIPVKYLASKLGWCQNIFRLPMCPLSKKNEPVLDELLKNI